ncbi:hypothetical protein EPA93_47550 [Ktedonosporobacter rubrisoli]|uniref:Uncharacterized protein n=1 Tax=Ktedonosporobacter rubrisoli TaxID=2509675 RepID=A0A4P6K6I6_KTERU|nr:hypothetical protein [Ktedonosporobacter rubrisoli]QBD83216.1 hypothetical protein EPA93_47550 [Ktedonosporobacter rubrisoli]
MSSIARSQIHHSQLSLGVLTDHELLMGAMHQGRGVQDLHLLPPEAGTTDGLLAYLWQQGLSSVWVLPASNFSQDCTCASLEQVGSRWLSLVRPATTDPQRPASALFWPRDLGNKHPRRHLTLTFPAYTGWDWSLPNATTLLATIVYLDQVLAHQITETPEQLASQLLAELRKDQQGWSSHSFSQEASSATEEKSAAYIQPEVAALSWMRPLTLVEQRQRYLHKYAHASRLLQACLDVRLGIGEQQSSPQGREADGIHPGIWHVQLERAGSLFDGKLLPGCLEQAWISTPLFACCQQIGYHVRVLEGIFWPQSHTQLKPWANNLWQAMTLLYTQPRRYRHLQARINAARSIRQIAELSISLLTHSQSRLAWEAQIRGRQQALLFTQLAQLVKLGLMPVLVKDDALWTVSDDPSPFTAAGNLLSSAPWSGFIPGYRVPLPLSREVQDALSSPASASEVAQMLDTLAEPSFSSR